MTAAAASSNTHATTGTRIPRGRRAVKNDIATAMTATAGAPYWMRVKPTGPVPMWGQF